MPSGTNWNFALVYIAYRTWDRDLTNTHTHTHIYIYIYIYNSIAVGLSVVYRTEFCAQGCDIA